MQELLLGSLRLVIEKKSWEFTNETGILTNKNVLFYRPSYDLVQQTIAI